MSTNELFERRFRDGLAALLESEPLPQPRWEDSPAAMRVENEAAPSRRWPLRLLAVAAILVVGGAAAAGAAWLLRPVPEPRPVPANGWVAITDERMDSNSTKPGAKELAAAF